MELEERLSYLENVRDWQSLVEELEKGIASSAANASKAQFHLKLGRVLETKFLAGREGAEALPGRLQAQPRAHGEPRGGAERLLGPRQAEHGPEAPRAGAEGRRGGRPRQRPAPRAGRRPLRPGRLGEGDGDLRPEPRGQRRAATRRPAAASADVQVEAATWQEHLAGLLREPNEHDEPAARRRACCCARPASRGGSPRTRPRACCSRAYAADALATGKSAALYEGLLAEQGRFDVLEQAQREILPADRGPQGRARSRSPSARAGSSGTRTSRSASRFLEEALKLDSDNEGAFFYLREAYGKKGGDWDRVLTIAEEAATRADDGGGTFLLAQAGTIAWRQLGQPHPRAPLVRAAERRLARAPAAPRVRGADRRDAATRAARQRRSTASAVAREPPHTTDVSPPRRRTTPRCHPSGRDPDASAPRSRWTALPPVAEPRPVARAARRRRGRPPPAAAAPRPLPQVTTAKIAELRQLADKQEAAKRYNEYVKTLLQLAALVPEARREDRALLQGGRSLRLEVRQPGRGREGLRGRTRHRSRTTRQPLDYLRQMYEKRRDWEKLLGSAAARGRSGCRRARSAPRSSSRSRSSPPSE